MTRPRDLRGRIRSLWWGSLPLRVLLTTLSLSIILILLTGGLLLQRATNGVVEAKKESSLNEAAGVHAFMQEQLRNPEVRGIAVHEALNQLADLVDAQAAQYRVVIMGPTSTLVSTGVKASSVPDELVRSVQGSQSMFITPTQVVYTDPEQAPEAGFAIGASLVGSNAEQYPIFYIFPMTSELQTLDSLRDAVLASGVLLTIALTAVAYLVTAQVVGPVRKASTTALRLASGELGERMEVQGTDDLASLARSMNRMAAELQQRIRELETLSTLQQRFVSDVSHELRTPLTTIKMASDVIFDAREELSALPRRSAELMATQIDRFDVLLADLLEISRFDAGAAVLALDEVSVSALVATEVAAVQPLAERLGVPLDQVVPEGHYNVAGDPRRIRRILRNLLTNAVEHAEGKPVTVTVAEGQDAVAVTVRDRGVGFAAEDANHVFDRFWRADPSRNRMVGGSGLGLSIAQEDARLHHGSLSAWGRPGRGAQFRLVLPKEPGRSIGQPPLPVIPVDDPGEAK